MSIYSFSAGAGLTTYGISKCISTCSQGVGKGQRRNEKADFGLKEITSGVALMAAGAFTEMDRLMLEGATTLKISALKLIESGAFVQSGATVATPAAEPAAASDMFVQSGASAATPAAEPTAEELANALYEKAVSLAKAPCTQETIDRLKSILSNACSSTTKKMFDVYNSTIGITCDKYIPWKDKFNLGGTGYIDGVFASDLPSPASWSIDPHNRPFIASKYECATEGAEKPEVGAIAWFQRYASGGPVAIGEHGSVRGCPAYALDRRYDEDEFIAILQKYFRGEPLVNDLGYKVTQIKLAQN